MYRKNEKRDGERAVKRGGRGGRRCVCVCGADRFTETVDWGSSCLLHSRLCCVCVYEECVCVCIYIYVCVCVSVYICVCVSSGKHHRSAKGCCVCERECVCVCVCEREREREREMCERSHVFHVLESRG